MCRQYLEPPLPCELGAERARLENGTELVGIEARLPRTAELVRDAATFEVADHQGGPVAGDLLAGAHRRGQRIERLVDLIEAVVERKDELLGLANLGLERLALGAGRAEPDEVAQRIGRTSCRCSCRDEGIRPAPAPPSGSSALASEILVS